MELGEFIKDWGVKKITTRPNKNTVSAGFGKGYKNLYRQAVGNAVIYWKRYHNNTKKVSLVKGCNQGHHISVPTILKGYVSVTETEKAFILVPGEKKTKAVVYKKPNIRAGKVLRVIGSRNIFGEDGCLAVAFAKEYPYLYQENIDDTIVLWKTGEGNKKKVSFRCNHYYIYLGVSPQTVHIVETEEAFILSPGSEREKEKARTKLMNRDKQYNFVEKGGIVRLKKEQREYLGGERFICENCGAYLMVKANKNGKKKVKTPFTSGSYIPYEMRDGTVFLYTPTY